MDYSYPGLSSLGVPRVPWHPQILAPQLTLFQPGWIVYAHHIITGTPGFLDLPTALMSPCKKFVKRGSLLGNEEPDF